jgi:alkylation response protein AidB-like acyl-CoA dehydrogenase
MSTAENSSDGLLSAIRAIESVIRQHADEAEKNHRLSQAVVDALGQAGLFRMWIPKTLGGLEVSPLTAYRAIEEVARLDGSTGWCVFIAVSSSITGAFLADLAAEEMFRQPLKVIGGSIAGVGKRWSKQTGIWSVAAGPTRVAVNTAAGCWPCAK